MDDWLKQIETESPQPLAFARFQQKREQRMDKKPWGWWLAVLAVMILGFWLGWKANEPVKTSSDPLHIKEEGVVYLLAQDLPPLEPFRLNDWP